MVQRNKRWTEADLKPAGRNGARRGRQRPQKRLIASKPLERDILRACLSYLSAHPKVAFVFRANTGLVSTPDGRRFKAGFKGCSDILGMLKGGRFLACEVKREGGQVTDDQAAFLGRVNADGGLGFIARDLDDCRYVLATHPAA